MIIIKTEDYLIIGGVLGLAVFAILGYAAPPKGEITNIQIVRA